MSEEEFNGWTNRETWAVKLHWDNNQGDCDFFHAQASEFKESGRGLHEFADFLKGVAEDIYELVIYKDVKESTAEARSFVDDVGSLWRVNWGEIARAYFDEVEEDA